MPRFSQQVLSALSNPQAGMLTGQAIANVGGRLAQIPANIRAEQERQRLLEEQALRRQAGQLAISSIGENDVSGAVDAAARLAGAGDTDAAMSVLGASQDITERQRAQETEQTKEARRKQLEKNAINKANTLGRPNDAAALVGADESTLRSYLMQRPEERKTSVMSAGSRLVDTVTGEVISEAPFKPAEPKEPKVNFQKRDDGSILVFSGTELVQTIEPPKTEGDQDAAMKLITKSVYLQNLVDKLSTDIGYTETGVVGQVSSMIGGTDAYDRDRDIINLKANLGFEQINEMKRQAAEAGASGTGLGQISNIEFMSLQSTVDALDVGMSKEAQLEALENIRKHLKVTQMLASGVAPKDAIDWNSETYKANGYHKDTVTGNVFYAPDGKNGQVYMLVDGKFVKARIF
jgi:hypothetical protein